MATIMGWNYRIVKRDYVSKSGEVETTYTLHEVYYNEDGSYHAMTIDAVAPCGYHDEEFDQDGIKDLKANIELMMKAFDKPVLDYETGKEV